VFAAAISEELECSTHFGVLSSCGKKVEADVVFGATRLMVLGLDPHQNGPKVRPIAHARLLVP
jgi:hypothetical protein